MFSIKNSYESVENIINFFHVIVQTYCNMVAESKGFKFDSVSAFYFDGIAKLERSGLQNVIFYYYNTLV